MLLGLSQSRDGGLVPVRVKPRAKASVIESVREGVLLISVAAAPTDGAANAAVLMVLAKALGVGRSTLALVRGHKSREKMICCSTLSIEQIHARLSIALPKDCRMISGGSDNRGSD